MYKPPPEKINHNNGREFPVPAGKIFSIKYIEFLELEASYQWQLIFRRTFMVKSDIVSMWLNSKGKPASASNITNYFSNTMFEVTDGNFLVGIIYIY